MARWLVVLAVLAAAFGWYWTRWRPLQDYKQLSGRLESVVNQELARSGIGDRDALQDVHTPHSELWLKWVETQRRFEADPQDLPKLMDRLSQAADAVGSRTMRREESPHLSVLEFGKGPFRMVRLEFVPRLAPAPFPVPKTPEAAIVIDDVAYDFPPMDHFAALGVPLTFAILPRDKNSKALAEKATQMRFPVILHLPMEPLDLAHNNPGSAALYLNMTPEQLEQQFEKDVASVPHIQGMNNHMGSAFTENADKMRLVLNWVKAKKLFFLDSHTTQHSTVPKVAKEVGVACLVNETFLDNEDDVAAIEKQLDLVLQLALKRKRTIAIGHYRRKHLVEALANKIPEFKAHGVTLVTLPSLYPK